MAKWTFKLVPVCASPYDSRQSSFVSIRVKVRVKIKYETKTQVKFKFLFCLVVFHHDLFFVLFFCDAHFLVRVRYVCYVQG